MFHWTLEVMSESYYHLLPNPYIVVYNCYGCLYSCRWSMNGTASSTDVCSIQRLNSHLHWTMWPAGDSDTPRYMVPTTLRQRRGYFITIFLSFTRGGIGILAPHKHCTVFSASTKFILFTNTHYNFVFQKICVTNLIQFILFIFFRLIFAENQLQIILARRWTVKKIPYTHLSLVNLGLGPLQ